MKKFGVLFVTAALLATMASCSESELNLCECGHGKDDVSCYLRITDVNKEGFVLTRTASEKNAFANGDAIGIWVEDTKTKGIYNGQAYDNIKLTNAGGTWNLAQNIALSTNEARVYAIYPYNEGMDSKIVALKYDDATDYLYDVKDGVSNSNTATGLNMKHIRSLMVVKLNKGNYVGDGVLGNSTITGPGLSLNGTYNLADSKFNSTEGSGKINMTNGTIPADGQLSEQWFVFTKPGAAKGKLSFSFTIDGVSFKEATTKENVVFEPGKKYIFNITINKDYHVEVENVEVEAWTDVNEDVTLTDN